jgi:dTDP-glucose pyrophosphorylase
MNKWKEVLVSAQTSIREAIQKLDASAQQIVLVVDERGALSGTITDGDVRRGILKGVSLADPVSSIMNPNPSAARYGESKEHILQLLKRKGLHHMPLVDECGQLVGLDFLDDLIESKTKENWVVLMAGGLGSRLHPLTSNCPKPMLKVGNKPLLETILESFIENGFRHFYISVNHLADVIIDYFGDGSKWGVEIQFLHEKERLGTAGALSLLPNKPSKPFLIMNGDVLTKVNFGQLLDFHNSSEAAATMCVRDFNYQVPYGVVRIDKHRITGIEEKPLQRFFVNAGIYVLNPQTLDLIQENTYLDMPTLFDRLIGLKKETVCFPVREYWLDIGQMSDYDKANGEYKDFFS